MISINQNRPVAQITTHLCAHFSKYQVLTLHLSGVSCTKHTATCTSVSWPGTLRTGRRLWKWPPTGKSIIEKRENRWNALTMTKRLTLTQRHNLTYSRSKFCCMTKWTNGINVRLRSASIGLSQFCGWHFGSGKRKVEWYCNTMVVLCTTRSSLRDFISHAP